MLLVDALVVVVVLVDMVVVVLVDFLLHVRLTEEWAVELGVKDGFVREAIWSCFLFLLGMCVGAVFWSLQG